MPTWQGRPGAENEGENIAELRGLEEDFEDCLTLLGQPGIHPHAASQGWCRVWPFLPHTAKWQHSQTSSKGSLLLHLSPSVARPRLS